MTERTKLPIEEQQRRLDLFDAICIKHPRLATIEERTQSLRRQTESRVAKNEQRKANAKGRPVKQHELWVLPIIGPSGSTKSTSMAEVIDKIYREPDLGDEDIPVLIVTIDATTRGPRQFQAQILQAYGDAAADEVMRTAVGYNAQIVNQGISGIARKKKTTVIVLDEAHNMLTYDGGQIGKQMAKIIKSLVNDAIFSVILMGTEDTKRLFKLDPELLSRCVPDGDIDLDRFDIKNAEDRDYFFKFVERLEGRMIRDGVIDDRLDLTGSLEAKATVYDMADGVIGIVSRILRMSLDRALRDGRTTPTWEDITNCFRAWNRTRKKAGFDPFDNGPQKETLAQLLKKNVKEPA
jgi:AAA domain